jgi:hypothetical protein
MHGRSTSVTVYNSRSVYNNRKAGPYGNPTIHIRVGAVQVYFTFDELNCRQARIILLRRNEGSDGIADNVKASCYLQKFRSLIGPDIGGDIKLFVQLLWVSKLANKAGGSKKDTANLHLAIVETIQETCLALQRQTLHHQGVDKMHCFAMRICHSCHIVASWNPIVAEEPLYHHSGLSVQLSSYGTLSIKLKQQMYIPPGAKRIQMVSTTLLCGQINPILWQVTQDHPVQDC